jgi:hypothetical protein
MHKNTGDIDRKIRGLVVAPLLLVAAWLFGFATIGGVISIVLAAVMVGTAAVGFCPVYQLLHVNTAGHATTDG